MTETQATDTTLVFIDTNILVYAKLAASPWYAAATSSLAALAEAGVDLWISRQVLREYLAVMTRPHTLTAPLRVEILVADVREFTAQLHVRLAANRCMTPISWPQCRCTAFIAY